MHFFVKHCRNCEIVLMEVWIASETVKTGSDKAILAKSKIHANTEYPGGDVCDNDGDGNGYGGRNKSRQTKLQMMCRDFVWPIIIITIVNVYVWFLQLFLKSFVNFFQHFVQLLKNCYFFNNKDSNFQKKSNFVEPIMRKLSVSFVFSSSNLHFLDL